MLKLKLQYFGPLMRRTDSLGKTLMLGKIEGRRRRGQQRMRSLDGITDSMDMSLSRFWEIVKGREGCRAADRVRQDLGTEQQERVKGMEGAEGERQLPGARAVNMWYLPQPSTCAPG